MKVGNQHFRTIWCDKTQMTVSFIDQTQLPFVFDVKQVSHYIDIVNAIASMQVRGAPLIGVAAAFGIALAVKEQCSDDFISKVAQTLIASRPTAVNLQWGVTRMLNTLLPLPTSLRLAAAWLEAEQMADEDVKQNQQIAINGLSLLKKLKVTKEKLNKADEPLNILTHCNAGWLATVDVGTALAPIYAAHDAGINVHVWVDETRPRNQGLLTAWELEQHGVPHTVIVDNAGGHLMQQGLVDCCIVGADRIAKNNDVCNKIGTYLKALAANDNGVPFYVAAPSNTFDLSIENGDMIDIENRHVNELSDIKGFDEEFTARVIKINRSSRMLNPAFDVTPASLITHFITEESVL
jgi:methylthioribose-1-phosphate isomerase